MAESIRLMLSMSQQHADTINEYSEYLEYLVNRSIDYTTKSLLSFDNEFRCRIAFEKIGLGDSDLRRTISDRHLHLQRRDSPESRIS